MDKVCYNQLVFAAPDHSEPVREQPALAPLSIRSCSCTGCDVDLSLVSVNARFCPRCGLRLNDDRLRGGERSSCFAGRAGNTTLPHTAPSAGPFTSLIVRGYANAMYRLGVRYEIRRNDAEAVRCYGKASHLGNEHAAARLLDVPLASRAVDHRPSDGVGAP